MLFLTQNYSEINNNVFILIMKRKFSKVIFKIKYIIPYTVLMFHCYCLCMLIYRSRLYLAEFCYA